MSNLINSIVSNFVVDKRDPRSVRSANVRGKNHFVVIVSVGTMMELQILICRQFVFDGVKLKLLLVVN